MERQRLMKYPPRVLTAYTPEEIIGRENLDTFTEHFKICLTENGGEFPEKKINREFAKETRAAIARVLDDLRENGFYPLGINEHGRIRWGVAVKSGSDVEFEKHLPRYQGKTIGELREMARNGYKKVRDTQGVEPVQKWQEDFEEVC